MHSCSQQDQKKMSKPCSQLNSKVIRDKAECHIIAAIEKKCSVVAFKCVWRVHDDEIERAWNLICEKRDECDLTLSKMSEVCFYFSAISTSKLDSKKKTSKRSQPDEARESDDSNEESQINPSQNLFTREKNISCNIILAVVSNSERFCSESIQDSTSSRKMWLRVLLVKSVEKKKFARPKPAMPSSEGPQKSLPHEFRGGVLSALSQVSD